MRQRLWRSLWRGLGIIALLWLCGVLALMVWIHQVGNQPNVMSADAILILGAGLNRSGAPGPALTRRTQYAADLWEQGFAQSLICTGGQAYPAPRSEAAACREILLNRGIPAANILMEDHSRSTEENALGTLALMQAQGWQAALVVSDSYHIFRAGLIFDYYYADTGIQVALTPVSANQIRSGEFYVYSLAREVVALHWWVFKRLFNLAVTDIPIL
jgi:uncharacterized SAM-binding protein YcdF (DUF218 family)